MPPILQQPALQTEQQRIRPGAVMFKPFRFAAVALACRIFSRNAAISWAVLGMTGPRRSHRGWGTSPLQITQEDECGTHAEVGRILVWPSCGTWRRNYSPGQACRRMKLKRLPRASSSWRRGALIDFNTLLKCART